MVKKELCENVVEVIGKIRVVRERGRAHRRCDMAIVLVLREEVVKIVCAYAPQSG